MALLVDDSSRAEARLPRPASVTPLQLILRTPRFGSVANIGIKLNTPSLPSRLPEHEYLKVNVQVLHIVTSCNMP